MNTAVLAPEVASAPSLKQQFDELHAHRVKTMAPADLAININQRAHLKAAFDPATAAQPGDVLADFVLTEVNGATLKLTELTANGPLVLVFFRFATCPACNIALPHYQRTLYPELQKLGVPLLAISPQRGDKLVDIKQRHGFDFLVATDTGNELGRQLGILYTFDDASRAAALARGSAIGDVTGTGTWELPMPTVLVVDRHRIIRFIDVAPDWLDRTETAPILQAVQQAR